MSLAIRAESSPGEVRVAVTSDARLLDYAIWRPGAPDGVGDLHKGRITARVPAMAGAFVALEGAEGFLPDSEGGAGATEGAAIAVRVTRAAQGGKGPRLTARLSDEDFALAGRSEAGSPARLRRGPNPVERFAALYPDAPVLADDPALRAKLRGSLGDRVRLERGGVFDEVLAGEIEALAESSVALPGGAMLHVHPTPALVAIDVDTGGATAARHGKAAAQLATNRAALPEIARQIRLRNLSGAILVDLAGLSPRRRMALGPAFARALAGDPVGPRFLGFTALGLGEIVRPRVHPPLHEVLRGPHAAGLAALRRIASDVAARPRIGPALRAAPAVIAALQADSEALSDFVRRSGCPLKLRADPALASLAWRLEWDTDRPGPRRNEDAA